MQADRPRNEGPLDTPICPVHGSRFPAVLLLGEQPRAPRRRTLHRLSSSSGIAKELARGLQASQDDRDQPVDGGFGGQAASGGDSMETVAREFLWRDVIADLAAGCALV